MGELGLMGIVVPCSSHHALQVRMMGELGLMGIVVPEEYGGAGLDYLAYLIGGWYGVVAGSYAILQRKHKLLFFGQTDFRW